MNKGRQGRHPLLFCSFLIILVALVSLASAKLETKVNPVPSILAKCLAPLSSLSWMTERPKTLPFCSAEEFKSYPAEKLMKMDSKQISSLPASYFESLRIDQAAPLSPRFITQLHKEQAMAIPREIAQVLPQKSRKALKKIKNKPGPIARAVLMGLSGIAAFVIFKYS